MKKTGKSRMLGASFYILLRAWKILALWYENLNNVLNLGRQYVKLFTQAEEKDVT